MEKCEFCGWPVGERVRYRDYLCSGVQTLGPDPFAEEIYGDSTEVWMCEGARYESAMDI